MKLLWAVGLVLSFVSVPGCSSVRADPASVAGAQPEPRRDIPRQESSPSSFPGRRSAVRTSDVEVHYETIQSLEAKLSLYRQKPIRGVAFWRIGQEPPGFWERGF